MVEPKNLHIDKLIFEEAKSFFSGGAKFRYWIGITNGKYKSDGSSVTWDDLHTGHGFTRNGCIYMNSSKENWHSGASCTQNSFYTVCEVKTD